jgi:hypothetical protein
MESTISFQRLEILNSTTVLDPIIGGGISGALLLGWQLNETSVGLAALGVVGSQLPLYTGPSKVPAGSRISGVRFTGPLDLSNGDIVIERSLFQPLAVGRGLPLVTTTDPSTGRATPRKVVIRDSTFDGSRLSLEAAGWTTAFSGIADLQRNEVRGFGKGFTLVNTGSQLDALIEGNYIYGLVGPAGSSATAFILRDFTNAQRSDRQLIVRSNRFVADSSNSTGAFFIQASSGRIANLTVEKNLLEGRGYNLSLEERAFGYSNLRAVSNRFVATQWGTTYTSGGEGWSAWQDNTRLTTTTPAAAPLPSLQSSPPPPVVALPTITLAVNRASTLEDGATNLVYTFTRTGATSSALSVNYSLAGTATSGIDYSGIAGTGSTRTVTFAAGSATATVTVDPTADSLVESNETVALAVAAGSGYLIGTSGSVTASLVNDDAAPRYSLFDRSGVAVNGQVFNDNQPLELGMTFNASQAGQVTELKYFRAAADANDTDVRSLRLWRVSDGALLATAAVTSASGQSGWQRAVLQQPVTIVAGQQYVVSYRTNDNYFATSNFFTPDRELGFDGLDNNAFSDPLGVLYAPQSNGGNAGGVYRYGTQNLIPNQSFQATNYWVDVSFVPAGAIQPTSPSPSPVVPTPQPAISLAVSTGALLEDGAANLVYTFRRSGATTSALSVNYSVGGTATLGSDYTGITASGATKTVTFAAGASTATVIVNPTADSIVEANESVALALVAGSGYSIATPGLVTGGITNDDSATPIVTGPPTNNALPIITLAVTPGSVSEDGATNLIYTFTRTGATASALNVGFSVGGTATNGSDYASIGSSVTFAANANTASVVVNPTADTTVESDETVALTLTRASGYTVGSTGSATGTITNDDRAPIVTAPPSSSALPGWKLNESNTGLAAFGIVGGDLPVYTGPYEIPAGSFISGVRFTSPVSLYQGNITIEKSYFQPTSAGRGLPIVSTTNYNGDYEPGKGKVIIRDSEFDGSKLSTETAGWATAFIGIADLQRNYVHGFGSGFALMNTGSQLDSLIEGNYITKLVAFGNPATTGNHNDAFTIRDFSDAQRSDRKAIIRNNRFVADSDNATGAFFIQAYSGRIDNVSIENNLLEGKGYNLGLEANNGGYSNVDAINNRFNPTGFGSTYTNGGPGWDTWQNNYRFNPLIADGAGTAVF